jgi:ubiquinone/menaquinone biosynthesis C-methylase UbiE
MDQQRMSVSQFGAKAANYLNSAVHATGADLQRLGAMAGQLHSKRALDLGCGAGHVSFALALGGANRVTAYDPSTEMLGVVAEVAATRGFEGVIDTCLGAAEELPFESSTFDLVVTRYSAHHWVSVPGALAECARVMVAGGRMVVIDVIAPEIPLFDTSLQVIEFLRDASHVRDYRASEWRRMYQAAGLSDPTITTWKLAIEFKAWIERIGTPADRVAALQSVLSELPSEARDYFQFGPERSFIVDSAWIEGSTDP